MAKFTTDYVNLIAANLRDRYKAGFPILKELLQNADDAGAKSLVFGYHDGFGDSAEHELLRGPALWLCNNGRFASEDRQAIRSFGLNSKAGEAGAIGKFGLGMKSVFHLCEAFFYVASDGNAKFHEILSPWFQDSGGYAKHASWDHLNNGDIALLDSVAVSQPLIRNGSSWFMLWIPLRRRSHVPMIEDEATAPIIDRYPGDEAGRDLDFFTEPGIDRRIGQVLPLLRHLQQVHFCGTPLLPPFSLRLELAGDGKRLDHVSDRMMAGSIDDGGPRPEWLRFMGIQTVRSGTEPFERLQASAAWPKSNAIIAGGKRGPVPDKAQPEGAVVISHADGRRGQLSLQWAVFLPAEEPALRFQAPIPASSREYAITLHGQFFVDSGRRGIDGLDGSGGALDVERSRNGSPSIQVEWNHALASDVVLPLLLPAIAEYVRRERFSDDHTAAFTDAFTRCRMSSDTGSGALFSSIYTLQIHREHVWVRTLRRDGASWDLQPASASNLRLLPRPVDSERERPWRALPGLHHLHDLVFVDASAPRIAPPIDHWDEEQVCQALDRLPAATLCSESALKYLLEFLSLHRLLTLNTERVQSHLVVQIRNALRASTLADLRSQTQLVRELIAFLPNGLWYGLGTRTSDAKSALPESIYRKLWSADTKTLLVPGDLAPDGEAGKPREADIEGWLQCVGAMAASGSEVGRCLDAADMLLQSLGPDRERQAAMVRRHPRLPVLKAIDVRTGEEVARSLEDLLAAHQRCLLFKGSDPKDRLGLTPQLQRGAQSLPLLVVRPQHAAFVESATQSGADNVPASNNAAAIFRCLGAQAIPPVLGAPETREGLLNHVGSVDQLDDEMVRRGVRYLLHGDRDHFDARDPLWKDPSGEDSPWVRLWRMVLDDSWNVLPVGLSGPIPDKCSSVLNIRIVDQISVANRLKSQASFDRVDATFFTTQERDAILGTLDDQNAWRRLPLHQDTHGAFGAIDGTCHLGSEPVLPAGFNTTMRFIVRSSEEAHERAQQRFIPPWTVTAAALELLGCAYPARYWRELLTMLPDSKKDSLPVAWRDVAWLPLRSGGTISPSSLLRLEGMHARIGQLAEACEYAYAGVAELDEEVALHPDFASLLALIPTDADALPALAQLMSNAGLSIGRHGNDAELHAGKNLAALAAMASLPAWSVVESAAGVTSFEDVARHLLPVIATGLDIASADRVIAEMANEAARLLPRAIIRTYLREWAGSAPGPELRSRLPGMRLPAADGKWRPADALAHGVFGVPPDYLIDPDAGETLAGIIVSNMASLEAIDTAHSEPAPAEGALDVALDGWAGTRLQGSIAPALGALIALFGDGARGLAERAMAPIAFDDYVMKLGWRDPGYDSAAMRMRWMGGNDSIHRPFSLIRPAFRQATGAAVTARALTGMEMAIPLANGDMIATLLAGPVNWLGGYGAEIRLRPLDCLDAFELERQKAIIQKTAENLLGELYNQHHANLSELWNLFEDADQVELEVARSLILEGLPQLMRQLPSVKRHPQVASALAVIDKARHDVASSRRAKSDVELRRERLAAGLESLEHLVESDASVQQTILDAIRRKVAGYQYEPSSIPFEILQNADDAVSEFQTMQRAEGRPGFPEDEIGRFVAVCAGQSLVLIHWGRPINHTGRNAGYRSDFAQDLERMLMLGASAKELGENVTGRFGLGFKSVLLATERPVIESGDLRFEIVAGCLPNRASLSPSARALASRCGHGVLRPTVIELPVDGDPAVLMGRFAALAGLCSVLSRGIRQIEAGSQHCHWQPSRLFGTADTRCEIGQARVPRKGGTVEATLLVLRSPKGDAVVRLDGVPVRYDHDAEHPVPAIWIHAPTRGTAAGGLVLNAEFDVDTGRGSLPQGKAAQRNLALALAFADELAPMVSELIECCVKDWAHWSGRLRAAAHTSASAFWYAFWSITLVDQPDADASQDARVVAACIDRLFDLACKLTGLVPNGLPSDLGAFVTVDEVRLAIRCDRMLPVLPLLASWPGFIEAWPAKCWCSIEVGEWLQRRCDEGKNSGIVELDRDAVLRGLGPQMRLTSADVPAIAAIIRTWPQGPMEVQGWKNGLARVMLQARNGTWRAVGTLYSPDSVDDLLTIVMPCDELLDEAYADHGGDWLLLSQYLVMHDFTADELAVRFILATTPQERQAAIDWLAANLDSGAVWNAIRARARATDWIIDAEAVQELLIDYGSADQVMILTRLGLADNDNDAENDETLQASELDLDTIHSWWVAHRDTLLPRYDKGLWPQRVDRMRLNDDDTDRDAWMTLFSLAIFRRFGRVRDEQNRGFLDFLHAHGWWATISRVDPRNGAEQWMDILREYADTSQVAGIYERWMDSFASLYRIARWFDEYVHLFRTLQYRDENEARQLLTPAADSSLSGTDFEAATLHRTLHVGHNLVIRELLRAGVLRSGVADRMAFMPGKAVRELFFAMGYGHIDSSEELYDLLVAHFDDVGMATFCGDYDIPVILLAHDSRLQAEAIAWAAARDEQSDWDEEEAA